MIRAYWYFLLGFGLVAVLFFRIASFEYSIAELRSEFNGIVKVTDNLRGYRFMRFGDDSAIQSAINRRSPHDLVIPYVRVAMAAVDFCPRFDSRVLVIGLGAGSMPMHVRRVCPSAVVDVVDIDPVVVRLAREYFAFTEDSATRVHVMDGRAFIDLVSQPYDVIYLDAFNGEDAPAHLQTKDFFNAAGRVLRPEGAVVSNVVLNSSYNAMLATQSAAFSSVAVLDVPAGRHNRILVARP